MLSMLLAYDADGNVVATLDHMVARDPDGNVIGLIDFAAHEHAGGRLRDVWDVSGAAGSGTWPEWIGARAYDFRVEIADGRIAALVHRQSGQRRERAKIEAAIAKRIALAKGDPADLRDLVGGPGRPLVLDDDGKTLGRTPLPEGTPAQLPIIRP